MAHRKEKPKSRTKGKPKGLWSKIFSAIFPCTTQSEGRKPRKKPSRDSTRKGSTKSGDKPARCKERASKAVKPTQGCAHRQASNLNQGPPQKTNFFQEQLSHAHLEEDRIPLPQQDDSYLGPAANQALPFDVSITPVVNGSPEQHGRDLFPYPDSSKCSIAPANSDDKNKDCGSRQITGLGISTAGFEYPNNQTSDNQDTFSQKEFDRYLSSSSPAPSETGATIGEDVQISSVHQRYEGIPQTFDSLPGFRDRRPRVALDCLMWCAPAPAPSPPQSKPVSRVPSVIEILYDSDSSFANSHHTVGTKRSAASSASTLPKEFHSSYPYESHPEAPQAGGLTVSTTGVGEPGGIGAYPHHLPMPALMLQTVPLSMTSAHFAGEGAPVTNHTPLCSTELRQTSYWTRRSSMKRKQESKLMDIEGEGGIARMDVSGIIGERNGGRKKVKDGTVSKVIGSRAAAGKSGYQTRSQGRKGRRDKAVSRIRAGHDRLMENTVAEGSIEADDTSHKYGSAGTSCRKREEMQPTVESVVSSSGGIWTL